MIHRCFAYRAIAVALMFAPLYVAHGARSEPNHAAIANPHDPVAHIARREAEGMRPGGFGMLMAAGTVDELIYNEIGNEVLLIKYLDTAVAGSGA